MSDDDSARRAARSAVGTFRATGAPPLAALLGTERVRPGGGDLELRFDPGRPEVARPLGVLDAAMLADLALGGALRSRLGGGFTMPTVSLTVRLDLAEVPDDVRVRAWGRDPVDNLADAHGQFLSRERVVGRAEATFGLSANATAVGVLPWERPAGSDPPRRFGRLDMALLAELDEAATALLTNPARRSWSEEILARACSGSGGAMLCTPTEAMVNRAGYVQGGVLFGLMWACARRGRLVAGHAVFMAPASAREPLEVAATTTTTTRRLAFAHVEARQAGRPVAMATFTLGRAPARAAAGTAPAAEPAARGRSPRAR